METPTLDHPDFSLRLYALAHAAAAELLEQKPKWEELPRWPLVWSLSRRCPDPDLLGAAGGAARLAADWLRWEKPAAPLPSEKCLAEMTLSFRLERRFHWALQSMEWGERAIPALVKLLRQEDQDLAQLAAFALGQLGRDILPDLEERWGWARAQERELICQCLWYLGPRARGCLNWLKAYDSPWARALYYAMEGQGWRALLDLRGHPLWLDEASLAGVAGLVFSQSPDDRRDALTALDGWGPASTQAYRLWSFLCQDPDPEVAQAAFERLLQSDAELPTEELQAALLLEFGSLRTSAMGRLLRQHRDWAELHGLSEKRMVDGHQQQRALFFSTELWQGDWNLRVFQYLIRYWLPDPGLAASLVPHFQSDSAPVREAALSAYLKLEGTQEPLMHICLRGRPEAARLVFRDFCSRQRWAEVFLCLQRPEILEAFASGYLLLEFLRRRDFDRLSAFVEEISRLQGDSDERLQKLAAETLLQVDVEAVRWEDWPFLSSAQHETLLALMEWRGQLAAGFVALVAQGKVSQTHALEVLRRRHPDALSVLLSALPLAAAKDLGPLFVLVRGFGVSAWDGLVPLLGAAPELAESVAVELGRLLESPIVQLRLLEQGLRFLEQVPPGRVRQILIPVLAEKLLGVKSAAEARRRDWALQLALVAGSCAAALYYLQRHYPEEASRQFREALLHADVAVRAEAVSVIRLARSDWRSFLEALNDPDPMLRIRIKLMLEGSTADA